jgi:hypothetical protein
MFIKIGKHTINTELIRYTEDLDDGNTAVHFSEDHSIQFTTKEFDAVWIRIQRAKK